MKLKILLLAAFAAGVFASIALASQPAGKGNPHDSTSTSTGAATAATTTTTAHGKKKGKVLVCHKLPTGHYVLIRVSANSAPAKGKRHGDVLAGQGGTCPGPIQAHASTSTSTGTTTTTTHS